MFGVSVLISGQHCAQTLLDFNGGASCVQIYVNQHDFFISRNRVQELSEVESDQLYLCFYLANFRPLNCSQMGVSPGSGL